MISQGIFPACTFARPCGHVPRQQKFVRGMHQGSIGCLAPVVQRIARGRPKVCSMAGPRRRMKAPASRGSSVVMGEPCEMNSAGKRACLGASAMDLMSGIGNARRGGLFQWT